MSLPLAFAWRDLLFANWPVDPAGVAAHLPAALAVRTFDGDAWLSIVAFRNVRTRPRGLPGFLGVGFPELNLRTYVSCDGEPGIYFFSLDCPSVASVIGARLLHRLPYYYARMRMEADDGRVSFRSRRFHPGDRPARFRARYGPDGESYVPERDSRAGFLTERRRLYTQGQDGAIRYTDVSHERWRLHPVAVDVAENTLFRASGFAEPEADPTCYYSPGVTVRTTRSRTFR